MTTIRARQSASMDPLGQEKSSVKAVPWWFRADAKDQKRQRRKQQAYGVDYHKA